MQTRSGRWLGVLFAAIAFSVGACVGPSAGTGSLDTASGRLHGTTSTAVVVPAGGSLDVPLAFEGSSLARVAAYVNDEGVAASFGSTTLTGTKQGTSWPLLAELTNPSDGPLHVTNATSQDQRVVVIVAIRTDRALTVTASPASLAAGQPATIDVVLTQPVAGDVVEAELVAPDGAKTPVTLTAAGSGHWTATVTPPAGGSYTVNAWTTGNGVRHGAIDLFVTGRDLTFTGGFTEQLADRDRDGHKDLVLTLPVTVTRAGTYEANGKLLDATGAQVANAEVFQQSLPSGTTTIDVVFSGIDIEPSGRSGPYRVVDVRSWLVVDGVRTTEDTVADLGLTRAHPVSEFQTG